MTSESKPISENFSLFSKITHELRDPIHGISGLSTYLNDNWNTLEELQKKLCISDISKAVNILENVVEQLFQLCSVSNENLIFNFQETNIINIIEKTISNANLFLVDKKSISIFLEYTSKEVYMLIDPFWIDRLINNLIVNAQKHSGAKNIKVEIEDTNDQIEISVVDDGIGIPKNELETIFAPFKQSSHIKGSEKGSGLGLTICREIVKAHDGEISAGNNEGNGAIIKFTLPKTKNMVL